jgi:hypothetical protein
MLKSGLNRRLPSHDLVASRYAPAPSYKSRRAKERAKEHEQVVKPLLDFNADVLLSMASWLRSSGFSAGEARYRGPISGIR